MSHTAQASNFLPTITPKPLRPGNSLQFHLTVTMSVPRSRILDLMRVLRLIRASIAHLTNIHQVQCRVFNRTFNPDRLRLGNKILRQRLKGPTLASYYPPRFRVIQELRRAYPDFEIEDEAEKERLEKLERQKARGKGAPKKRRTKAGLSELLHCSMGLELTRLQIRSGSRRGDLGSQRLRDVACTGRRTELQRRDTPSPKPEHAILLHILYIYPNKDALP